MNPTRVSGIAAAAMFSSLLSAQQPLQHVLDQVPSRITRQADESSGASGLWTMGRDYKASFHDGFRMTLPVGELAPKAPVFAWTTQSVLVGTETQALHRAAPQLVGQTRCEYDLGAIVEAYDVSREGVEQTFVLREPVAGELVVRGRVGGDFAGSRSEPHHGAITLHDRQGLRSLTYGAATAIDAHGASLPITTSLDDGLIELRVPAAWLANAAYPVVVDPLLLPVPVTTVYVPIPYVSVEHDDRNASLNVCVAVEYAYSASDHDVVFFLVDDTFTSPTIVFSRTNTADQTQPQAVFVNAPNKWAFAYSYVGSSGENCYWMRHTGADPTDDSGVTSATVTAQANGRQRRAVLGGNREFTSTGTYALLVREWESAASTGNTAQTEIWASLLNLATGNEGSTFRVAGGGFPIAIDSEAPSVSRDCRDGSWVVAWQGISALTNKWGVNVRRVDQNGAMASGILAMDLAGQPLHLIAPQVDGADGRYLVAFGTVDTATHPGAIAGANAQALHAMRFDWHEGVAAAVAQPSHTVAAGVLARAWTLDSLVHDTTTKSHWALTGANTTAATTVVQVLGFQGLVVESNSLPTAGAAATGVTFDDDHARFEIAFLAATGTVSCIEWRYPTASAPSLYGTACVNATNSWFGDFRIGSEFAQVRLLNGSANGIVLLMLSTQGVNLDMTGLGFPGCALLVDPSPGAWLGALATTTLGNGTTSIALPLPETLAPGDLFAQWAVLDPALTNGLGATRGLRIEIR